MKPTQKTLKAINTPVIRRRLMDVLGYTEFSISKDMQKSSDNLIKATAMQVILEITGLPDSEILANN